VTDAASRAAAGPPAALPPGVSLHPWSRDFAWQRPPAPPRTLTPAQADAFERDGFVVLEGVLGPDALGEVTHEIDAWERRVDEFLRTRPEERLHIAESGAITFSVHLVLRSAAARALTAHPTLVGLCADLAGADVNLYWDQAVYKKPEKPRRFPWHQDNGYTFVEPQQYLTCWIALTDATTENGCPWIAPGLHRLGTLRHRWVDPLGWECFAEPPVAPRAAPAPAGSVVVFSSLTPHLTGPNATDAARKAYIVQYAPAGARAYEGDANAGPPRAERPCDDPGRQYAVLRSGRAVAPPPLAPPGENAS